ncbi:hypothetical protein JAAARDRAFT_48712 [Jaapia argillacea MUCL 33604]|uniref:Uncharacterized protein n=1 Tax=Jaapia argillacea MUCL 33604 TaxID=933084 RepID=A0A067PY89_9AGAM|nr:hypothetical protein JAAARDRAFT_48712 [Jaapia argillacea MUCL 33604]
MALGCWIELDGQERLAMRMLRAPRAGPTRTMRPHDPYDLSDSRFIAEGKGGAEGEGEGGQEEGSEVEGRAQDGRSDEVRLGTSEAGIDLGNGVPEERWGGGSGSKGEGGGTGGIDEDGFENDRTQLDYFVTSLAHPTSLSSSSDCQPTASQSSVSVHATIIPPTQHPSTAILSPDESEHEKQSSLGIAASLFGDQELDGEEYIRDVSKTEVMVSDDESQVQNAREVSRYSDISTFASTLTNIHSMSLTKLTLYIPKYEPTRNLPQQFLHEPFSGAKWH